MSHWADHVDQRAAIAVLFLLEHARPAIMRIARADSCIFSTRVAVGVCRKLGIDARPLATRAMVFNPALAARFDEWCQKHPGLYPNPEMVRDWQHNLVGDCWSVGIGYGHDQPGGYAGHLVCLVQEGCIVDLSLDQGSRPEHDIELAETAFDAHPLLDGSGPAAFHCKNGCVLRYELHPHDDRKWERSPDWLDYQRSEPLIHALVEQYRSVLIQHGGLNAALGGAR